MKTPKIPEELLHDRGRSRRETLPGAASKKRHRNAGKKKRIRNDIAVEISQLCSHGACMCLHVLACACMWLHGWFVEIITERCHGSSVFGTAYLVVGFWLRNLKMKCNLFISMYKVCVFSMYVQHVC